MSHINRSSLTRRAALGAFASSAACLGAAPARAQFFWSTPPEAPPPAPAPLTRQSARGAARTETDALFRSLYGPIADAFPVRGLRPGELNPAYARVEVYYPSREAPGTIVIDPHRHFLYHVEGDGRAMRYGVGVGREGFAWTGAATINSKQEWPDWYPPKEMIERQPELQAKVSQLRSGLGVPGGLRNPLGARALYLWQGNKDTLFRIHGTTEPGSIGRSVSSGCIRMVNQDVIDLYARVAVGSRVVVLG